MSVFHEPMQTQFSPAKSTIHDVGGGQNTITCCAVPNVSVSDRRSFPFAGCGTGTDSTRFSHSDLRSSAVDSTIHPESSAQCALVGMPSSGFVPATTCAGCVTECTQPTCSAAELTSNCTKQCVVICNNFSHNETNCPGDVVDLPCDMVTSCTDCGFEDIVGTHLFDYTDAIF
jgi:hypothetical protein